MKLGKPKKSSTSKTSSETKIKNDKALWSDQRRQDGRIFLINRALNKLKKGQFLTADKLGELCGVTRQAIGPYIKHMREFLLLPIIKGPSNRGIAYSEKVDIVPHLLVSQDLCYNLMLALKSSSGFCDEKQRKSLKRIYKRIASLMHERGDLDFVAMDNCLSFSSILTPRFDPKLIKFFWRCAVEKIQVELFYDTPATGEKKRTLNVLHLRKLLHDWIVFCEDSLSGKVKRFSLARMDEIRLTGKTFVPKKPFVLSEHNDGAFEVFVGPKMFDIQLYFRKPEAHIIRENYVSCESARKDLLCGGLELSLSASSFVDLLKLMRSFGNNVVPLSPPELVQEWHTVADLMSADGKAVAAGKFQFDPPRKKEPEAKV
ncbi:MAG: putative helix-turn-helix, type 11 domain protein [Verrucomicrobiales bacterium]|nr:putative helix-turn-helix, type 11 domain protein [Verrucomicrobiales bacterium]